MASAYKRMTGNASVADKKTSKNLFSGSHHGSVNVIKRSIVGNGASQISHKKGGTGVKTKTGGKKSNVPVSNNDLLNSMRLKGGQTNVFSS